MKRQSLNVERNFALLVAAAVAGERCPQTNPHGPLQGGAIPALIREGRIRSEVYALNFRRVVITAGEHKGKATAPDPKGGAPWKVNGVNLDRAGLRVERRSRADRIRDAAQRAPVRRMKPPRPEVPPVDRPAAAISLPKLSFLDKTEGR